MSMRCCYIIAILLFTTVGCVTRQLILPKIAYTAEVLHPRGFRVSIDNEEGIEVAIFLGNINRTMSSSLLSENEMFAKKVTQPTDNRWVFEDKEAELKNGDVIYFKLIVVKDWQAYSRNGNFTVSGAPPTTTTAVDDITSSTKHFTSPVLVTEPTIQKYADPEYKTSLDLANAVFSTVENLTSEIKRLKDVNSILIELVEQNSSSSRNFTLKGILPPYDDNIYIAQVVVKEKLHLQVPVVTAKKNADGSISFEVASIDDKIKVIKAAKRYLKDSKIQLIY